MIHDKPVVFDIETIANKSLTSMLPDVRLDTRLKDLVKIQKDIEKKRLDQVSKMGLDPMFNMICLFGWCDENGPGYIQLKDESDQAERDLILEMWEVLARYDKFVTFNGRNFDVKCMLMHGMDYRIRPSVNIDKGRYNRGNHVDLRNVLSGDDKFAPGKLDFYCRRFLGIGKMEGIDGAMVQGYWDMGLIDDIREYNQDEVQLMWDLYLKVLDAGLLE